MGDDQARLPGSENTTSGNIKAGGVSAYQPLTWLEMNDLLFRIQSGALSPDAVSGITTVYTQRESIEEVARRQREGDREAYETLMHVNRSQRELFELAQEMLDLLDDLIKLDRRNARRFDIFRQFQDQEVAIRYSLAQMGRDIDNISTLRENSEREFYRMIRAGKESDEPQQARAAEVIDRRRLAGGQVVTVTYRIGDEVGAMPQHLVYEDEQKRRYIKNTDGSSLYIDELPVSAEERAKMNTEIERQRNDRRYTRDGGVEQFGNENPDRAREFEEANAALKREIESGNPYMLVYDEMMAQGRGFRNSLAAKRKEYADLEQQQANVRLEMARVEEQISTTPQAKELFDQLKVKLGEFETKKSALGIELLRENEALIRRFDVVKYLSGNAHSEETLLRNLPDQSLQQRVTDTQTVLRNRLKKVQEMEEQIAVQKTNIDRQAQTTATVATEVQAVREHYTATVDTNITRGEWMASSSEGPRTEDFVRDSQGRVVSYDQVYGLFYTTIINEKTKAEERHVYRDPAEILGFFKDAWDRGKRLGNEHEIASLRLNNHLADVDLTIDFSAQASQAIQQSLTMQQNLLSAERSQIEEALRTGGSGSGGPTPATDAAASSRSVASQVDPDSSSAVNRFNSVAPNPNTGAGVMTPNTGNLDAEKKKPVVSVTSDAGRSQFNQ